MTKINWLRASLSRRLMIYSVLFTFLLLVSFWTVLFFSLKHDLQKQDEDLVRDRMHTITSLLQSENGPSDRLSHRIEREWSERNYERILVRILGPQGERITETPHLSPADSELLQSLRRPGEQLRRLELDSHIYEAASADISVAQRPYRIEIALERTSEQQILARFQMFFIYILGAGAFASLWIGRQIVRIALKPVHDFSRLAVRVHSDHLSERIDAATLPIEFRELAYTLNGMLDRLSESFSRLTRFSQDMAHELRTPVGNLLGSMEVALSRERGADEYRNIIGSGLEECERLKRIIDSLLFIARSSDPSQTIEKHTLLLCEELADIVSFYEVSAEEKKIDLQLDVSSDLRLLGERTHIQRCIGNLLSNSIRHSPELSTITLQAEARPGEVVISVIDRGCGIPDSALDRVGERFFRIEASRAKIYGGTGLGLSIAKSIVEIHGGTMTVRSREGAGTTVELLFPTEI